MGVFRYGDRIAKIRTVPTAESLAALTHQIVDGRADDEAFRRTLVAWAAERDHSFELQVQLNAELARMPVDNTSGKWSVGGDDNVAAADATSITPWRSREEHRPIGEIRRPSPTERTVNRALSAARAPVEKATARPRRPAGLGAGRGSG
jgi:hypothetical protein